MKKNRTTKHSNRKTGSKDEEKQRIDETNSQKQDHKLKPSQISNCIK